jgi:TetR/AcrR family transcriptional regulator, regulator of cefoperazone and chloramphenicol sensitivity
MKSPASAAPSVTRRRIASTAPATPSPKPTADTRKSRAGGIEARQQLLMTALKLFSEKGFAKTSTRAIAEAAGVNIASISYYFGDKAGLYRAVFTEPMGNSASDIEKFSQLHFTLRESLDGFIRGFLEPMKQGELVQQCMRLHFREMLEPTGMWEHEIDGDIKPAHAALLAVLGRHLNVASADEDLHRLAFGIAGLAIHLYMARDVINAIRPSLLASQPAIDLWATQMVDQAEAMVAIEAARRNPEKS